MGTRERVHVRLVYMGLLKTKICPRPGKERGRQAEDQGSLTAYTDNVVRNIDVEAYLLIFIGTS